MIHEIVCWVYLSESPQGGDSFEYTQHTVTYRVFDYFKYHTFFHVYYKFLYINRTFWKNMFTITSCLCSFWNFPERIF